MKRVVPWVESSGVVVMSNDIVRVIEILSLAEEKGCVLNARATALASLYIALCERGETPNEELFAKAANISAETLRKYVKSLKTLL